MSMQLQNLNSLRHIKGRLGSKGNFTPLKNAVGLDQLISTEKITIKCCNSLINTHSHIWPWHFPAELKNELALRWLIVPLKPRQLINNYDIRQMEISFLLKGSMKLESSIPGLKYNVLDLYFSGETLATSDIDGSSNRLTSLTDSESPLVNKTPPSVTTISFLFEHELDKSQENLFCRSGGKKGHSLCYKY